MKSLIFLIVLAGMLPMSLFGQEYSKPIIGINMDVVTTSTTTPVNLTVRSTYVDSVYAAGGFPVVLPPILSREDIKRQVEMVDGFVFIGGADINPARYGRAPHEAHNQVNPRREEYDFMLMEEALKANKPVLAICLGMQELNVFTGGKLIQDIPTEVQTTLDHRPGQGGTHIAHEVEVVDGTRLHSLLQLDTVPVNSSHHQACEIVGPNTIISARATDGTIEGIELPQYDFAVGVQWHPEYLTSNETHLSLFRGLVNAATQGRLASERQQP